MCISIQQYMCEPDAFKELLSSTAFNVYHLTVLLCMYVYRRHTIYRGTLLLHSTAVVMVKKRCSQRTAISIYKGSRSFFGFRGVSCLRVFLRSEISTTKYLFGVLSKIMDYVVCLFSRKTPRKIPTRGTGVVEARETHVRALQ